ncbi:MAG: Rid family hydrolase, partial [Pseudomonadota bacterium]
MQNLVGIFVLSVLALVSFAASAHEPPVFHKAAQYEGRDLPFSTAVQVGSLLFLSGVIGTDPDTGKLAKGGIQGETRAALNDIKNTVEGLGSSMDKVVKCTVFLADIGEWAAMNEVYVTFFPNNKPARSALGS